jgi:hypothetical protein
MRRGEEAGYPLGAAMILGALRGHPASRVIASNDLRISAQVY